MNSRLSVLGRTAVWYASHLRWRVLPLVPGDKQPLLRGRGCYDATLDPEAIVNWWMRTPDANVGIATGPASGIFVVDIDPRNGGDEELAVLEERIGRLPETVEACTGGGGRHFFYLFPLELRDIKWSPLAPGVDLKGTGGYVVGTPSLHPSGERYVWEASSRPDDVAISRPSPELVREILKRSGRRGPALRERAQPIPPESFALGREFLQWGDLGPEIRPGMWAVRCPNEHLHTCGEAFDGSTVLFAPRYPGRGRGYVHCLHEHCRALAS